MINSAREGSCYVLDRLCLVDVSRVKLFGNLRTSWEQQMKHQDDENFASDFELSDVASSTLLQLTTVQNLNIIRSNSVKQLDIEGNRIKVSLFFVFYLAV